ncbi:amino acid adenylation domain-containing protein [Paractinoplanes rhizophilus]|uniref:Amino acid adenylation domain-containing protein n=1 Tax=Paractinoplanes rhizophilus TaxID=1416877 RepID=A0ABW2HWR1_9ACTN
MTDARERIAQLSPERQALLRRRLQLAREARIEAARIPRADRGGPLPLSFGQQRLWFLDQLAPGLPTYKSPWVLRLHTLLDVPRLQAALTALVARHEILRTRYLAEDGLPYQVIDPPPDLLPLACTDLSAAPAEEREALMRAYVLAELRRPADLAAGPAARALLYRLADDDHVVMLDMHHISTDGWSVAVLARELLTLYQGAALPPLGIQYADFASWQRARLGTDDMRELIGYWTDRLDGLPALDFPSDRPRPAQRTWGGATLFRTLPAALREQADTLARANGWTPLTVWLAGLNALLARYTGQDDIVVGSIFSGRVRPELEPLLGCFANTLVLRTALDGHPSFADVLARTHETLLGAHEHQDAPFDQVVDALKPDRDSGRNPLFDICVVYQGAAAAAPGGPIRVESVPLTSSTSRFDLAMYLAVTAQGELSVSFEYSTELFDEARIAAFTDHFERLMTALLADPGRCAGDVDLLTDRERHDHLVTWNDTGADHGTADRCLHDLVTGAADTVAARFEGTDLTYGDLRACAAGLAHVLHDAGIGPDDRVGVLVDRSLHLPVALLGVLTAGAAYVPLDPTHPPARTALVLDDSACRAVVATRDLAGLLPPAVTPIWVEQVAPAEAPPAVATHPGNLAYVVYTSGSTGRPKGVAVSHAAAVNYAGSVGRMFAIRPGERVLQFSNPCFDVSVLDIFGALCHGATLVLAPRSTLVDPDALAAFLRTEHITVAAVAPAMLAVTEPGDLPHLRVVSAAGEAYPAAVVDRWSAPHRVFHNGYGPTEVTVICVDHECAPSAEAPPIGRPMPNHRAYVLDRGGRLAPVGVPGELLVGGAGVARGYLGRPGPTAQKFTPDPFGPPGGRLYHTGDLVVRAADGVLRYLGRLDDQVKIRGFRVEPGEVTTALAAHPGVAAALVVARDDGDGLRLVAYLVPAGDPPAVEELRAHLGATLPPYLIPAAFVVLSELPLTPNGKIDRKALPAPDQSRPDLDVAYVAPRTDIERRLHDIWAGVLRLDRLGVDDNFFALGGNSLQATQLVSRIRAAFDSELDLRTFFGNPSIAALAALAEAQREKADEDALAMLAEIGDLTDDEVAALLAEES